MLLASLLVAALVTAVKADTTGSPTTIGLWHLDEVKPSGDSQISPAAVGQTDAILGGTRTPVLVDGEFDKAMQFNGQNAIFVPIMFWVGFPPTPRPIYIPISPTFNIQREIKLDAWINVQGFTNGTYNNIVVKCNRIDGTWENTSQVVGLAIRGTGIPEDGVAVPAGSLSGFLRTENGVFNEIVTSQPIISLNQWTHVTFTRQADGMHLYVNGYEQAVTTIHGTQNPTGNIANGTEIYFGHDAQVTIDEISIVDLAPLKVVEAATVDIGTNTLIAAIVVSLIFAIAWLLRRAIQMQVIHSRTS